MWEIIKVFAIIAVVIIVYRRITKTTGLDTALAICVGIGVVVIIVNPSAWILGIFDSALFYILARTFIKIGERNKRIAKESGIRNKSNNIIPEDYNSVGAGLDYGALDTTGVHPASVFRTEY